MCARARLHVCMHGWRWMHVCMSNVRMQVEWRRVWSAWKAWSVETRDWRPEARDWKTGDRGVGTEWKLWSGVWSVERRECRVWSAACGLWSVHWEVWSVECGECGVWNVERGVWSEAWDMHSVCLCVCDMVCPLMSTCSWLLLHSLKYSTALGFLIRGFDQVFKTSLVNLVATSGANPKHPSLGRRVPVLGALNCCIYRLGQPKVPTINLHSALKCSITPERKKTSEQVTWPVQFFALVSTNGPDFVAMECMIPSHGLYQE